MSERRLTARQSATATPPGRDRVVDFLRAGAACLVIMGHWLAVMVIYEDGRLGGQHILAVLPWAQWLTWGFQVMGVFFVVGGYANAASWDSAQRRGQNYVGWVHGRATRLLQPTTLFIVVGALLAAGARLAGVAPQTVRQGAWLVAISLWFLAVYLLVVAAAPMMLAAHRRWGLAVVVVLTFAVTGFDALRLLTGVPALGAANFLLVWLVIHQLGFFWQDGGLTAHRARAWWLVGGGLTVLVLLTTAGPYPVSMVAVPDAPVQNTSPPTVALIALAVTQTGFAVLAADRLRPWLQRRVVWAGVIGLNGVLMTLFLWHMAALFVAAVALYVPEVMPQPELGSLGWWALRPLWVVACSVVMVALVAVFARFEQPARSPTAPGWLHRKPIAAPLNRLPALPCVLLGITANALGTFQLTITGFQGNGPAGLPVAALGTYLTGLVLLAVARHPAAA